MDKYEYEVRLSEIKALAARREFEEAAKIADTIDWRRQRGINTLGLISEVYRKCERYQDSYDIMLLAYDRHPTGRGIVYALCDLAIKLGDVVHAIEYLKEFREIAKDDVGQYILQYRLYEAQDVSIEERIEVLKKLVQCDPTQGKWYYELAYLYHRIGFTSSCIDTCDEVFLYIVDGKYVIKALELKAKHVALSEGQQKVYDAWLREQNGLEVPDYTIEEELQTAEQYEDQKDDSYYEEDAEVYDDEPQQTGDTLVAENIQRSNQSQGEDLIADLPTMELPEVKTVDVSMYNTINLEKAVAEGLQEFLQEEGMSEVSQDEQFVSETDDAFSESTDVLEDGEVFFEDEPDAELTEESETEDYIEDSEIISEEELSEDAETLQAAEETDDSVRDVLIAPLLEETLPLPQVNELEQDADGELIEDEPVAENLPEEELSEEDVIEESDSEEESTYIDEENVTEAVQEPEQQDILTPANTTSSEYDKILSQEYDGQISLVVPDEAMVEKQITGQMTVEELMVEWERIKANNKKERMEGVQQRILAHTGDLFANFDEATKNDVLGELERESFKAIEEEAKKPPIKHVIHPDKDEPQEYNEMDFVEETVLTDEDEVEELEEIEDTFAEDEYEEPSTVEKEPEESDESVQQVEEPEFAEDSAEDEIEEEEQVTSEKPKQQKTSPKKEKKPSSDKKPEKRRPAEKEEAQKKDNTAENAPVEESKVRDLTEDEMEMFGQFARKRKAKQQLANVLDNMSLASCTGNIIITGDEADRTMTLAKGLIREMQYNDNNFSGKVARIAGAALNKKDIAETFARLDNGALIIEDASALKAPTIAKISKVLEKDNKGLLLIMIDRKHKMNKMLGANGKIANNFNLRIDVEALDADTLVSYAKEYAADLEYSIDEFGVLALHTRIADMQTSDHAVTLAEVRDLVDDAIYFANKKTPKHFMDILFGKRYDKEDMIILREKDFMHY